MPSSGSRGVVGRVARTLAKNASGLTSCVVEIETVKRGRTAVEFFKRVFALCLVIFIAIGVAGTVSIGSDVINNLDQQTNTTATLWTFCKFATVSVGFALREGVYWISSALVIFIVVLLMANRLWHLEDEQIVMERHVVLRLLSVMGPGVLREIGYLSADGIVTDINAAIVALAPFVAVLFPSLQTYFRISSSISLFKRYFDDISSLWSRLIGFFNLQTQSVKIGIGAALAVSGLWVFSKWTTRVPKSRKRKQVDGLRIVPKKKQFSLDEMPNCVPVDPRELSYNRMFPESPGFRGVGLCLGSLVRIKSGYAATAFRVGNCMVTAGHCITRRADNGELGMFLENPEDRKFYWAPLEKNFPSPSAKLADSIAVCSIPYGDFFMSLKSVSIRAPKEGNFKVGTFILNGIDGKAMWDTSNGDAIFKDDVFAFRSGARPGSSGGPIVNTDGSCVAIVSSEGHTSNFGLQVTEEVRDFLTKPGGVKPSGLDQAYADPSDTDSSLTSDSEISSSDDEEILNSDGNGPTPPGKKKKPKSPNSNGTTSNEGRTKAQKNKARREARAAKRQAKIDQEELENFDDKDDLKRRRKQPKNPDGPEDPADHVSS